MNLHEIVSGAINSVNPFQTITVYSRSDYTVNDYGEAVATMGEAQTYKAQVQPINSEDIRFINNYNQSEEYKAFWVSADVSGLNRPLLKGGDKVVCNGKTYFVSNMPEDWYETVGWNHFIGCLQLNEQIEETTEESVEGGENGNG